MQVVAGAADFSKIQFEVWIHFLELLALPLGNHIMGKVRTWQDKPAVFQPRRELELLFQWFSNPADPQKCSGVFPQCFIMTNSKSTEKLKECTVSTRVPPAWTLQWTFSCTCFVMYLFPLSFLGDGSIPPHPSVFFKIHFKVCSRH